MGYEFLEHTADVKFRAEGGSLQEAFSSAAGALNETIRGEIEILEQEEVGFEVEGTDNVSLLYNFLEEFLFLLDAQDFLVARIKEISIEGSKLKCVVVGDAAENYKFTNDVKAVTYSEMKVERKDLMSGSDLAGGSDLASEQISTQMNAVPSPTNDSDGLGHANEHRFEKGIGEEGVGERWVCEVVLDV